MSGTKQLKWENTGIKARKLIIKGKLTLIAPGEEFSATEAEVPVTFRDIFKCKNAEVSTVGKKVVKYELVKAEGGLFDVVGSDDKVYTSEPIEEAKAKALIANLKKTK